MAYKDSRLSLPQPWVQSLLRERRLHKPHGMAKKRKEGKKEIPVPERSRATDFFFHFERGHIAIDVDIF